MSAHTSGGVGETGFCQCAVLCCAVQCSALQCSSEAQLDV